MSLPKYEGMPHFYFCTKKCCKHSVLSSRRIKGEWVTRLRIADKALVAQGIKEYNREMEAYMIHEPWAELCDHLIREFCNSDFIKQLEDHDMLKPMLDGQLEELLQNHLIQIRNQIEQPEWVKKYVEDRNE